MLQTACTSEASSRVRRLGPHGDSSPLYESAERNAVLLEELADAGCDFVTVGLEREMACIEHVGLDVLQVSAIGRSSLGREDKVVLSPDDEERAVGTCGRTPGRLDREARWCGSHKTDRVEFRRCRGGRDRAGPKPRWWGSRRVVSFTPFSYRHLVDFGLTRNRMASRFSGVGSFQYFLMGSQNCRRPSSYALPF